MGIEIWFAAENADTVWDALVAAGATPVGSDALELYRIVRGVPRFGVDLRERDLPQETGQQHALNFAKGCYIGQEIVERIRSRGNVHRMFTGFEVQGDPAAEPPAAGTKVRVNDKDVGEMTSAARVPFPSGERTLALGYVRREVAPPGRHGADRRADRHRATLPSTNQRVNSEPMPDKEKKSEFVVTDRRLFSTDGELRQDVVEDEERRAEREREKARSAATGQ